MPGSLSCPFPLLCLSPPPPWGRTNEKTERERERETLREREEHEREGAGQREPGTTERHVEAQRVSNLVSAPDPQRSASSLPQKLLKSLNLFKFFKFSKSLLGVILETSLEIF